MTEVQGRLGLAGAGRRGIDSEKVSQGVLLTVPSGIFKGLEIRVRYPGNNNPAHRKFMDQWVSGKFREVIANRKGSDAEIDLDSLNMDGIRATQTPEYVAHVLVADLPQGVAIPERADSMDDLPECIHDYYMPEEDGDGFRRKKNRKDWVEYTPEVGTWIFNQPRYSDLIDWIWKFGAQEGRFLEEKEKAEGNG